MISALLGMCAGTEGARSQTDLGAYCGDAGDNCETRSVLECVFLSAVSYLWHLFSKDKCALAGHGGTHL